MIQEEGTVIRIKNNLAYVEIHKSAKCEGCRNCAFGANNTVVLPSLMRTVCAAGDRVLLQMPQASFAGASLLLFLIPLLLMLIGFFAGMMLGVLLMLLFGFGMFVLGILISVFADSLLRKNPKFSPIVIKKL